MNIPSRTYKCTVCHTNLILGSTWWHPVTWGDYNIILYDDLIHGICGGIYLQDYDLALMEYDGNVNSISIIYKWVLFIVDNGCLSWFYTIPSFQDAVSYTYVQFSEWLESMCKDIEYPFSILKSQFTMLGYGIHIHIVKTVMRFG